MYVNNTGILDYELRLLEIPFKYFIDETGSFNILKIYLYTQCVIEVSLTPITPLLK